MKNHCMYSSVFFPVSDNASNMKNGWSLTWWCGREGKWPALAKMVKQYLAAPASSAGVERVFSAAGKMHGDLQKSAKDSTLEHSLFAAFNTD